MGCASSKIDDLPAVALCRERCTFLDEAINQRFVLAETHIGYVHSLKQVGQCLHNFISNQASSGGGGGVASSPKLNLPPSKKGGDGGGGDGGGISIKEVTANNNNSGGKDGHHHSHSNSGHIEFHSDPDDDSGSDSSFSHHSSPLHDDHHLHYDNNAVGQNDYYNSDVNYMMGRGVADQETPGGFMHMNYMKNQAKPSIVYAQKPVTPEIVRHHHVGESSSSSSSNPYYPPPPYNPYQYPYNPYPGNNLNSNFSSYGNYGGYPPPNYGGGGGGGGGYYGLPPTYGSSSPPPPAAVASSSKPPPPPPSPPRASAWDFLNPFESYDKYFPPYTPSRDSKELREEEGIPDLEDEDYHQHEVVKKVHVDEKFVDVGGGGGGGGPPGGGGGGGGGGGVVGDEAGHIGSAEASLYQTRPSVDNEGVEYEVHVVEKKVVGGEKNEEQSNAARAGSRDVLDVAREIEVQFARASDSGIEIAKMLEVGKLPYQRKHVSKMLHVVTPSLSVVSSQPSTSTSAEASSSTNKASPAHLDMDEDMAMRTKSLSSTLHKLYLWEKKLYNEVKAEEKMRVIHDRKVSKLKRMDERGAEAHKIDATRTQIRNLSTKIGMAIQVVDKISVTINKIRDEELWPQLNELIQGLTRMWKSMLECHRSQCQAIKEAKGLGALGFGKNISDEHLEVTSQLEHELLNWTLRFSSWIGAQKGYVRALNNWLLKCLLYEPEETADGIVPFSPGRIGAPPVFVICNQWSQALERISEKDVIDSMRLLSMGVFQLWEQDKLEMRQMMVGNKDSERQVRNLDREDQKIQKKIQALDKKIVVSGDGLLVPGHVVYQSDTSSSNLQGSLQRIFEAMERFTSDSLKAYEELLQRSEEERLARESERIP